MNQLLLLKKTIYDIIKLFKNIYINIIELK